MKTKISASDILKKLGLNELNKSEKEAFLAEFYVVLDDAVGKRLIGGLSSKDLDEFNALTDEKDQKDFISRKYPDYRNIVLEEVEKLNLQLKSSSSAVLKQVKQNRE